MENVIVDKNTPLWFTSKGLVTLDDYCKQTLNKPSYRSPTPTPLSVTECILRLARFVGMLGFGMVRKGKQYHIVSNGLTFGKEALTLEEAVSLYNYGQFTIPKGEYLARANHVAIYIAPKMLEEAYKYKKDDQPLGLQRFRGGLKLSSQPAISKAKDYMDEVTAAIKVRG